MQLSSLFVVGLVGLSSLGFADQNSKIEHPWLIRVRAMNMVPLNHSRSFSALETSFPSNAVRLNTKTFPEVDFTYFFTQNWAAELVLTYPQRHDVTLAGVGKIGTVTHLPPILSVQYHWPIEGSAFKPYIGVGINYTRITEADLSVSGVGLDVTRNSFGLAFGAGFDYKINDTWSINFDYKHVNIRTNVKVGSTSGPILTNLNVDPNLFSIGVGYRF